MDSIRWDRGDCKFAAALAKKYPELWYYFEHYNLVWRRYGPGSYGWEAETGVIEPDCYGECKDHVDIYSYIGCKYQWALKLTTPHHYKRLKISDGITPQTAKRNGLARVLSGLTSVPLDEAPWLIPFKDEKGKLLNFQIFDNVSRVTRLFPGIEPAVWGLDRLGPPTKPLLIVGKPLHAIKLDGHLTDLKTRKRYDILALPEPGTFLPSWAQYLAGRKEVRVCLDNSGEGRKGLAAIAGAVRRAGTQCGLKGLRWPAGVPEGYDVADLIGDGFNVVEYTRKYCQPVGTKVAERTGAGLRLWDPGRVA